MSKTPSAHTRSTPTRTVAISNFPIELSKLLKFADLTSSGGEAKHAIREGLVLLNGVVETRKGKKLVAGDQITFGGETVILQAE